MALETGGSLFWRTGIDNTGLKTGAVQAKGILRGLARSITGMDIFAGLAIGATLVFAKITKEAYNFSKNFETAMKEVQTISEAVEDNFKGMSKEIIDMSKTVPDTALKLTKALYQIVSAGYDGAKAMDILRVSTELAVATVTDTFTAADALTYVMNAYGAAAGTASEISDKLFTIIRLGKVKMEELGPTLSMVTGLAAEAGMSFNDLGAFYAEAVKKIQPHIVSTGIRGFVTALLRASKEGQASAKAAKEMGIEFDIATLKSKGLEYMLKQMSEATEGQKQKLMELFPNVRGLIGLLAIMTNEGANYNKTLNEIENSLGATDKAFKTMVETTESQWAILKNNVMAKMKPLGDNLLGFMNNIASGINIAMSGANDELSKLARSYSELTDTLRRKQSRIDDLIATVEDLRGKTKLTKEETTELEAAERALAVFFPIFGRAVEDAAGSIDILTLAKEGTIDLSIRIMELELAQADIEMRRADLTKELYDRYEDEGNKEIKRIKGRMIVIEKLTEYELAGADKRRGRAQEEIYTKEKLAEMVDKSLEKNNEYLDLMNELSLATEKRTLEEDQLILNQEKSRIEVDALTESLENLRKTRERPIVTTKPEGKIPGVEPTIIPILTDEEIENIKDKLAYMADQYKSYWKIVAQFGEEYVEEHNAQLTEDARNYGKFLSGMLAEHGEVAELTKEIMLNIAEYNKEITEKRIKAEEEYFNYIASEREKELEAERNKFRTIIEDYKEGSSEYLMAVEKHNKNVLEINEKYDKEISEARLTIFKEDLEQQIGELDKNYKLRLELAKTVLGKMTKANKDYFEFIKNKLEEIAKIEKEISDEKEKILRSYFESYQTIEEKIVSIHERTAELLKLTDDEYERSRLKSIEKQLIAAVRFNEARQEMNDKWAEYGEKLNNQELEEYIGFLEEMKIKYSSFADAVILLNEKIAESQKQIWENTRNEINQTADLLHNLASVVGEFDSELQQMIDRIADLVSGIGQITFGFTTGNIFGILGGIITAISSIFNLFVVHHSDVAEIEEQLHEITLELQAQHDILNLAIGTEKPEAIQNIIDLLHEQIAVYNEMIEAEQEAYGQFLWWTWSETDQANIEQWLATIQDINAEIAYLNQQYQEILTGTTAEAIADAIAEGFAQGLESAQIFADTFNEMMKKAMLDAFKRTIIMRYLEEWYNQFAGFAQDGLTAEEIDLLAQAYLSFLEMAATQWEEIQAVLATVGIFFEEETIEEIIEQAEEAIRAIADITEETIADSIADGFYQGLTSAEVFADTFNDMMRDAIINAFKETIITKYIKDWYDQFAILYEGGLTVEEIEALTGTYQEMIEAAATQWEAMKALLEASGMGLKEAIEGAGITGLRGAIAGITEETAGLLAGQFQAIRINTVEMLSHMESIIIINSRIADNTEFNKYLKHLKSIDDKLSGVSSESEAMRGTGGV